MRKLTFASDMLPAELRPQQRARAWADTLSSRDDWDVDCPQPEGFSGRAEVLGLPSVQISRCEATSIRLTRTESHVRRSGNDFGFVLINAGLSPLFGRQAGKEQTLRHGEAMFFDYARSKVSGAELGGRALGIFVSRQALSGVPGGIEPLAGTVIAQSEALSLLRGYLGVLLDGRPPANDQLAAAAGRHIGELVAMSLGVAVAAPPREEEIDAAAGARIALIVEAIALRCGNDVLDAAAIGTTLGLSARTVQHLLTQAGTTFSAELREARMKRAEAMLSSKAYDDHPIVAIAHDCGFSDLSTFYRAVTARFGHTPGEIRKQARETR